jgi:8-oxo-dGTP diphosphatase
MITLNSDTICLETPEQAFDAPFQFRLRESGGLLGHIIVSDKSVLTVTNANASSEQIEEAILSISQYLLRRGYVNSLSVAGMSAEIRYADNHGHINLESINQYSQSMTIISAAIIILQQPDGSVLLGQRPKGKFMPGLWEFPGGKIEPMETPEQAGCREIKEELGIQMGASIEISEYDYCFLNFCLNAHLRLSKIWTGNPTNLHHTNLTWVQPDQLFKYDMPLSNVLALPEILKIIN